MKKLNIDVKSFSEYIVNFIHDINEYNLNNNLEKEISPFKLQILLYFVNAYALTAWDKKLWNDSFEKWVIGPVIPKVYFQYAKYGNKQINKTNNNIEFKKLTNLTNIEKLELEALMLEVNNKFNNIELFEISHSFPWQNAQYNTKINDQDIIDYYSKKNTNDRFINEIIRKPTLESDFKFLD